jgi:phosphate transport system protein
MQRNFDTEIQAVKTQLMTMGAEAERGLARVIEGLTACDSSHFDEMLAIEARVNNAQVAIDEACLKLLALQAPLASDLRLVVAMIKANNDIERMADQAKNLARIGREFIRKPSLALPVAIASLGGAVKDIVHDAFIAFLRTDATLARSVLERDDTIDRMRDEIVRAALEHTEKAPADVRTAMDLILIARNLERIADHATNVAEDAIFVSSGEDVRHRYAK